ncbi:MAG: hypothetical protein HQ522_04050 [Bacteroidetes bacterium]|nr:hypothetical protein [Bacteroidota bacterium]
MKNNINKILLFTLVVFMCGCHSSKPTVKTEELAIPKNQIIFLIFSIENKDSVNTVKLTDKIISIGKLKTISQQTTSINPGDLKCIFLDKNGQILSEITIPNPLKNQLEYFDENGKGGRKEVILKENTFHIRTQLQNEMFSIKIEENTAANKWKELAEFRL